ncbi:DUF2938 family protein [Idiomarina sp.]|uniref:DUF2938 family protein n=1 Tax=Idiomarina sp. TaxID=1874361 RepID=UPI00258724F8|nr:DUF2938 family protein [Idiomarina sp.]
MDLWSLVRKSLFGTPLPNYGMVGRWLAHMTHGQFRHNAIVKSRQVAGEHLIGWPAHYRNTRIARSAGFTFEGLPLRLLGLLPKSFKFIEVTVGSVFTLLT